jgi:alanyl-tRNA synthetase
VTGVQAVEQILRYFKENNKADAYFAILDVDGNAKVLISSCQQQAEFYTVYVRQILQNVVLQGKKLDKAVYVFSVDHDAGKVVHGNYVPGSMRSKGLDGRIWATKVTEVLGGKVTTGFFSPPSTMLPADHAWQTGGKEDSAQGVGTNVGKVDDAMVIAREYFLTAKRVG